MGLNTQVGYCVRSLDGVPQASHHDLMISAGDMCENYLGLST